MQFHCDVRKYIRKNVKAILSSIVTAVVVVVIALYVSGTEEAVKLFKGNYFYPAIAFIVMLLIFWHRAQVHIYFLMKNNITKLQRQIDEVPYQQILENIENDCDDISEIAREAFMYSRVRRAANRDDLNDAKIILEQNLNTWTNEFSDKLHEHNLRESHQQLHTFVIDKNNLGNDDKTLNPDFNNQVCRAIGLRRLYGEIRSSLRKKAKVQFQKKRNA